MTANQLADCRSCKHSYESPLSGSIYCTDSGCKAIAVCELFERKPGSDVEEYIEFQDGHVSPDMGRGD